MIIVCNITIRFIVFDDVTWFEKMIARVVLEELSEEMVDDVKSDQWFCDFLR